MLHRSEITSDRWIDTSFIRTDGKEEFREKPEYGNQHAVFESDTEWGEVHVDEYNAADFPFGTIDHLSKYTEERTGVPETIARGVIVLGGLILGAKLLNYLEDNLE